MPAFNPVIASLNFTHAQSFFDAAHSFATERSLIFNFVGNHWNSFIAFLSQPPVYAVVIAWVVTFTIVIAAILSLGFGPAGVVAGSLAAAFQATMYGGFTPAAGIFATLTSIAMLGLMMPAAAIVAGCIATLVALAVWSRGVGTT